MPSPFAAKKQSILASLAVPDSQYNDLSPKGSIDAPIRDFLDEINTFDSLVTTSSCSGRIVVYLDGPKHVDDGLELTAGTTRDDGAAETRDIATGAATTVPTPIATSTSESTSKVGSKGGGSWLLVSHDPLTEPLTWNTIVRDNKDLELAESAATRRHRSRSQVVKDTECVGARRNSDRESEQSGRRESISCASPSGEPGSKRHRGDRLVRCRFEPMILHILASSLESARRVLIAAQSAGFRESGISGLSGLSGSRHGREHVDYHGNGSDAIMVNLAVRTTGLTFDSVIATCRDGHGHDDGDGDVDGTARRRDPDNGDGENNNDHDHDNTHEHDQDNESDKLGDGRPRLVLRPVVSADYLLMLTEMSNKCFETNRQRTARFRDALLASFDQSNDTHGYDTRRSDPGRSWEDAATRAARKRAEGLERAAEVEQARRAVLQRTQRAEHGNVPADEVDLDLSGLGLDED